MSMRSHLRNTGVAVSTSSPNLLFASGSYSENKILSTSGGPPDQRRKKTDINWLTEHMYRKREWVSPVLPKFVI